MNEGFIPYLANVVSEGVNSLIKLNENERIVLKEIVEGRTEYLFSRTPEGETNGLPTTLFHLKNFGYITAIDISTKDGVGYTDVKLTEKAKEEL